MINDIFNAKGFDPESSWAEKDCLIVDVNPGMPPTVPWTEEILCKNFLSSTLFMKSSASQEFWNHFNGNVRSLLPSYKGDLEKMLLFAILGL
jgi:hypothetical protein